VVMKSRIIWDITPISYIKTEISSSWFLCLLLAWCWFLAWLIILPCRWKRHVPPKCPLQLSHSQVRVQRDSWPHFTVWDSRLPQPGGPGPPYLHLPGAGWNGYNLRHRVPSSSLPTTRTATVEVFHLPPHESSSSESQSQSHIATDGQSISKSWCRAPSAAHDQIFITFWHLRPCFSGAPSLTRGWVCLLYMLLRVSWDSWPYFTVSDLRLSFSSPPKTRRWCSEAEAEAYCRQPAGTLKPGIGPRWDPWPYICSMLRPMFCFVFPFVDSPYWQRMGWSLIYI
jgi:hypothetical protein